MKKHVKNMIENAHKEMMQRCSKVKAEIITDKKCEHCKGFYKTTNQLLPIICNTRDYILYETLNIESVKIAIDKLKENIKWKN